MLVRYSLFPQDPPTNGLCSHELFVLARAVSATPPSIAIEALVLGGPEVVRVVLNSSSSTTVKVCVIDFWSVKRPMRIRLLSEALACLVSESVQFS